MGASVGKTVSLSSGDVTILKLIGEGGFAEIFLVRSERDKKIRALKRMVVAREDQEKHKIAKWEFQINQRFMKHPNIVSCESAQMIPHPNGDIEYLILLEYCDGGNLLDWINAPHPQTIRTNADVIHIFRQLIDAVAVLHAHQPPIRHQDLKPENLLYSGESGTWKLCDMGSSTTDNFQPKTSGERVVVGGLLEKTTTPSYRSPEMCDLFSGKPINQQSDIWACGCILYTMLFRVQPFPDGALGTLSGKYHIPDNHKWSPSLIDLLGRCFHPDPRKRITIVELQYAMAELAGTKVNLVPQWSMFKAVTPTPTPAAPAPTTAAATTTASPPIPSRPVKASSATAAPPTAPAPAPAAAFDMDDFNPSFPDPAAASVSVAPPPRPAMPPPANPIAKTTSPATPTVPLQPTPLPPPPTQSTLTPASTPNMQPIGAPTPKLNGPMNFSLGTIKIGHAAPHSNTSASAAAKVDKVDKKSKKSISLDVNGPTTTTTAAAIAAGDDASDDEDDPYSDRAIAKYVKKLTKDEPTPLKSKHLNKLIRASWHHRPDVALRHQQLLAAASSSSPTASPASVPSPDELARHMLAWDGVSHLFPSLTKRSTSITKKNIALKSCMLIHRMLQGGSPTILGQVYQNRSFLEQIETYWMNYQQSTTPPISNSEPIPSTIIALYAKHLLHRLAFHQLHPHYEGSFALGHFMWSTIRTNAGNNNNPSTLHIDPKMARDDVHHLLQLMAESLRLGQSVFEGNVTSTPAVAGGSESNIVSDIDSLDDASLHFRHQLLLPLLDDLYAMFLSCSFMLAQVCLVLGIRPLALAPSGLPRGVITKEMREKIAASTAAAATAATAGASQSPPPPIYTPTPIPIGSSLAYQIDPHPLNIEVPLDTPPASVEEDHIIRTIPTLLQAHKTILGRMHYLFSRVHTSSVVRESGKVYLLPSTLVLCQPIGVDFFPPSSLIPLTRDANQHMCKQLQSANEEFGQTKHRSIGPKMTFLHALPPPLSQQVDGTTNAAAQSIASPNQMARDLAPATAEMDDVPPPSASGATAPAFAVFQTTVSPPASASAPSSASPPSGVASSPSPAAPLRTPGRTTVDPFVDPFSSPASPLGSPKGAADDASSSSPFGPTSPVPIVGGSSSSAVDDDDPFASSATQMSQSSNRDDPFQNDPFAQFMKPHTNNNTIQTPVAAAIPTAASIAINNATFQTPFSDEGDEVNDQLTNQTMPSSNAATPFDTMTPMRHSVGQSRLDSDAFDEEGDVENHGATFLSSDESDDDDDDNGRDSIGLASNVGRVRTEADYLPKDYVRRTSTTHTTLTQPSNSIGVASPFDDTNGGHPGDDSDDDDDADGPKLAAWSRQEDDPNVSLGMPLTQPDRTPFNEDDPFTIAEQQQLQHQQQQSTLPVSPSHQPIPIDETPFDTIENTNKTNNPIPTNNISNNPTPAIVTRPEPSPFDDDLTDVTPSQSAKVATLALSSAKPVLHSSPFDEEPNTPAVPIPAAKTLAIPVPASSLRARHPSSGNPFDGDDDDAAPPSSVTPATAASTSTAASSSGASSSTPSVTLVGPSSTKPPIPRRPSVTLLPDEIDVSELVFDHRIGVGAFAEVFAGEWRSSEVAIKRLYAHQFLTDDAREEFRREIQLLRHLRHPNILLFMAACPQPESLCIVTELCTTSLFDLLHNSDTPMPWRLCLQIACDTAKGMSYLHSNKGGAILHRDLKSPNVLLDSSRRAKVCDFGLSDTKGKSKLLIGQIGTHQYMAPEILAGKEYHEAADVFSFAIIMWEIASRRIPYAGKSASEISIAVLNQGYRLPIPANCPSAFAALIGACWTVDPDDRPDFPFIVQKLQEQLAEAKLKPPEWRP